MSKHNPTPSDDSQQPKGEPAEAQGSEDRAAAKAQGGADTGQPAKENAQKPASAEAATAEESNEYEALRSDLEQMKDRALRVQAELENYRKRVAREMADERRYAELGLLRDLLPVLDNMDRAVEAAEKSGEAPQLLEGFRMVAQQLKGILERHHCVSIQALHQPFDPNFHEAILQQPSAEHPAGTVIYVASPGYRLHDRVVRPAQVIVSAPAGPQQAGPGENKP